MDMRRRRRLLTMQANSLGYLVIRCGQLWNDRGIAGVNAEAGAPVLREAHTRLIPLLLEPEGVRITELAARLEVSKQAVQPLVADLLGLGLVSVEVDPVDARARRVRLTDLGLEAMLHGTGVLRRIEATLRPRLGRAETRILKRLLTRLLKVLEARGEEKGRRAGF